MTAWTYTLRRALLWALSRALALVAAPWRVAGELALRIRFNRGYRRAPLMLDVNTGPVSDRLALAILDGQLAPDWLPLLDRLVGELHVPAPEQGPPTARDMAWSLALFSAYRLGHRAGRNEAAPARMGP